MQDPFIYNIAEVCAQLGVKDIILSPGSRCAPLTIAFNRHPDVSVRTISDERSAAYIALGLSLGTKNPVGLVCTSGTAAANYLPAVAEAFYQKVPLIVFTADRPPEWINQQDNQAIQQYNLYGKHVKQYYQLPVDLSHKDAKWHMVRSVSEAINNAKEYPKGPVHVNVPFREPFYPDKDTVIKFDSLRIPFISVNKSGEFIFSDALREKLHSSKSIIILGGQQEYDEGITNILSSLSNKGIPVIGDVISNLHDVKDIINHPDLFLAQKENKILKPDLIISFGDNILSKNIKTFFRNNKADNHWHIQSAGQIADTFQSITNVIRTSPKSFFKYLNEEKLTLHSDFKEKWIQSEGSITKKVKKYLEENPEGELAAVSHFLKVVPQNTNLHLANSMAVRYANIVGLPLNRGIEVFANRGTSGIDGCNSTAVGVSLSNPGQQNYLITGDMAFLYDRNAFWHNYPYDNLKILVLNNGGGGIFRLIDGPAELPELEEYFETRQRFKAENTAKEFGFEYYNAIHASDISTLKPTLDSSGAKFLIEYFSDSKLNQKEFKRFKGQIALPDNNK